MKNDHQRRRVISRNKQRGGFIIYEMNGLMVGSGTRRGGFELKGGVKKKGKDENHLRELDQRKKELCREMDELSREIDKEEGENNIALKDREQMRRELGSVDEIVRECEEEIRDLIGMISKADTNTSSHELLEREIKALEKSEEELRNRKKKLEEELKGLEEEQRKNETHEIQSLR